MGGQYNLHIRIQASDERDKPTKSSKKAKETKRTLQIYHGEFATQQTFNGVFNVLRDSLQAHPTEFAIITERGTCAASHEGLLALYPEEARG